MFDFDGTILDTEHAEFQGLTDVFESHGASISHDDITPFIGTTSEIPWPALLRSRTLKPFDEQKVRDAKTAAVRHHINLLTPRDGVLELFDVAKSRGMTLGIASNAPRLWVHHHIRRLGLAAYFDVMLGVDDVPVGKPHPQVYLDVCQQLRVPPEHALAIEDSPTGAAAALAAGMTCVACPTPVTASARFDDRCLRVTTLIDVWINDRHELHLGTRDS